jgi:predicted heme/steroid binding protein
MNPRTSLRTRLSLAAAPLALAACLEQVDKTEPALPDAAFVFAVTSDYKTGAYAAYGLESGASLPGIDANHSDAAVRYHGGSDIFILNRLGRDNLLVVDKKNLKVVMAVKFPAASNPYDIEAKDGTLYASFLAYDSILAYRQEDGKPQGGIDIHAYADSDGFAEAAALAFAGDYLYAAVQNLDTKHGFKALAGPKLLQIDVKKRQVAKAFTLPFPNPAGLAYDPSSGKIYVACEGQVFDESYAIVADGGIVSVDPATGSIAVLAKGEDLGGNMGNPILHGGKLFFPVSQADADQVMALSLADNSVSDVVKLGAYQTGGLGIDPGTNTLAIGDRGKGLRLFRLDTYEEKQNSGIDLGLPPSGLVIVR